MCSTPKLTEEIQECIGTVLTSAPCSYANNPLLTKSTWLANLCLLQLPLVHRLESFQSRVVNCSQGY
ncbi:unnamed protein product [Allacma fusca]|uniref:Uncharacterized protein n=1 Tax=Allacma fusca TaxID=39272 RepID=A0A8J2PQ38_9HEXA|nr:unnamed protein product [Allacma fusca]